MKSSVLIVFASLASLAQALVFGKTATKSSAVTDEAIAVFGKAFPFDREPVKNQPFVYLGMPDRDIDGTPTKKPISKEAQGKRFTDISEKQARKSFEDLVKCYGEEQSLEMLKASPIILAFDSKQFKPALDGFAEVFGLEEAKAMVGRNPGLLAVSPKEALKSTDQTMTFSYIIGATRPFGPALLVTLAVLLSIPAIEGITGVPIRVELFQALTGAGQDDAVATLTKAATPVWKW